MKEVAVAKGQMRGCLVCREKTWCLPHEPRLCARHMDIKCGGCSQNFWSRPSIRGFVPSKPTRPQRFRGEWYHPLCVDAIHQDDFPEWEWITLEGTKWESDKVIIDLGPDDRTVVTWSDGKVQLAENVHGRSV